MPRRTKIVATLGPACHSPKAIAALIAAGVDVARINASHGSHTAHAEAIAWVRAAADQAERPVAILFDLQGPKIRVGGNLVADIVIQTNEHFVIAVDRVPKLGEVPCDYRMLDQDVKVGEPLLINDGALACSIVDVADKSIVVKALSDGVIQKRKGINLPKSHLSAQALTDKDAQDALFAAQQGVDLIALSFVRDKRDIDALRSVLASHRYDVPIVAKIEKPQALENLDAIIEASWGVMVARGDLGVELSLEDVPMAQKRIIAACNRHSRPVITATQMLDSMTRNPKPTRAEASDVANAVLDGTDAVMLSQETAIGPFCVGAVQMMGKIIDATENGPESQRAPLKMPQRPHSPGAKTPAAVAEAGCAVAKTLAAKAIVVFTETGRMAHLTAYNRPDVPIVAYAQAPGVVRRLALVWGTTPFLDVSNAVFAPSMQHGIKTLDQILCRQNLAHTGDTLVLLVGAPNAPTGSTNAMLVHQVGKADALAASAAAP